MKRLFDIILGIILLLGFFIPIIIIILFIKFDSKGPILFFSKRIGKENNVYKMPKFRTMIENTPLVATDKLKNPKKYLTKFGIFLRKYSLDEIPQLISVILGHMSLVGPRPALYNQLDLIKERNKLGINKLRPGITGLAQIKGRDNLSLNEKIKFDLDYLRKNSFFFDICILAKTVFVVLKRKDISH